MNLLYTKQFTFLKYIDFFFLWSNPWPETRGPIRDPFQSDLVWSGPIQVTLTLPKMICAITSNISLSVFISPVPGSYELWNFPRPMVLLEIPVVS